MEPSDVPPRQFTLDEAIAIAIELQKHGQFAEAAKVYRKILGLVPDHRDALHFSGVLAHQEGRSEEGQALLERSLTIDPDQADAWSNLGIILRDRGKLVEAADAYRRAIAIHPEHANAHSNLGVVLKATGQTADAESEYRTAIQLNPNHVDAHHNLGVLLSGRGRLREAVECFCRVTTLSPHHPETRRLLAHAHCTLGETDKAIEIYEQWVAEDPDDPVARHMLAACSGQAVPARASDAFVEQVFDGFASSFDVKLAQLSYCAPDIVSALVADAGLAQDGALDILDAGCGTGLCGVRLKPYARSLTGVDLSSKMLERAREKGVYDALVQGELTAYLRANPGAFDLIVSADTFVYFGRLDEVIGAAAGALRPGGHLVFTLESMGEGEAGRDFALANHGRYCHSRTYAEQVLAGAGFEADLAGVELRMEAGLPVVGLAVRAVHGAGRERTMTKAGAAHA